MARVGRFGRRPRSAPSLTSTIIAIAQAAQSQRDQNITDAWKNGGSFQGESVTDEKLLAYWRKRLDGISLKDPLYDQYSNTVLQLEYAIEESKNSTLYAQGKITDAQRAQFFLDWAKKVPPDSEFYRTLQRNAAQFLRVVKARGAAGTRAASDAARAAASKKTYDTYEATGDFLTQLFTAIAKGTRIIQTDKTLINDLQVKSAVGGVSDPERLQQVIDGINRDPSAFLPNVFDQNGRRVTGQQVLDAIKRFDPSFSGVLTSDYYAQTLRSQLRGQSIRYAEAVQNGTKTEQNQIKDLMTDTAEGARQAAVWDTAESYAVARRQWEAVVASGTATPDEIDAAWRAFQQQLAKLAGDNNNPIDDITRSALLAEGGLTTKDGLPDPSVPTLTEAFTGTEAGTTGPDDNSKTRLSLAFIQSQREAVASGRAVWAFGSTIVPDARTGPVGTEIRPGGSRVVAVTIDAARSAGAQVAYLPQAGTASAIPVYVSSTGVETRASGPQGQDIDPARYTAPGGAFSNALQVRVFDYFYGGQKVRFYAYADGKGAIRYTSDPPWGSDVSETVDPKTGNVILDLTPMVASQVQAGPAGGRELSSATDSNGKRTTRTLTGSLVWETVTDASGKSTSTVVGYDPSAAWDQVRQHAGVNEATDFLTLGTASVKAISQIAPSEVREIVSDPVVQMQMQQEATKVAASSMRISNPFSVDPNNPGDLTDYTQRYNEVMGQFNRVIEATYGSVSDAVRPGQKMGSGTPSFAPENLPLAGQFVPPLPQGVTSATSPVRPIADILYPSSGASQTGGPDIPPIKVSTSITAPEMPLGSRPGPYVAPLNPILSPELQPAPTPSRDKTEPTYKPPTYFPPAPAPSPGQETTSAAIEEGSATYTPGGLKGF